MNVRFGGLPPLKSLTLPVGALGVPASAVAVQPVIGALRAQRARQRERLAGLAMATEQLHRATQAEQRVVVRGRLRGHGVELGGGAFIAARVEQGPPERLANRSLLRLPVARFAERHDRRLVVAVLEQLAAALVQVIHAFHGRPF